MNKQYGLFLMLVSLLLSGCLEHDNAISPVSQPSVEVIKTGTILSADTWSGTDTLYRVVGDCSIEANITFKQGIMVVVDSAATVHIAHGGVLTIEEGCTLQFGNGASIETGDRSYGTLIAQGSALSPIYFKAAEQTHEWGLSYGKRKGGVVFGDSAINSSLRYCTISDAVAGVYIAAGSPSITNCTITRCKDGGIYFDSAAGPANSVSFTNNTIGDCGGFPLTLPAGKLGNFSGDIIFAGTTGDKNAIRILGTGVEDSMAIWRKRALPYLFTGTTLVSSFTMITRVTIMPGVICQFAPGASIIIGDPRFGSGELFARGNLTDSIFFVNAPSLSVWGDSIGGIQVGMESPANTVLEYCSIKNATTGLYVNPGVRVSVSHCLVTGCTSNGITFAGGSRVDSLSFVNSVCEGNGGYGISIPAEQLANLSTTNTLSGNGSGPFLVTGSGD